MLTPEMMMMKNPSGGPTAWAAGAISSASYDNASLSVATWDGTPGPGLAFNGDGTELFVRGVLGNDVLVWSLSTPYDISSAGTNPDTSFGFDSNATFGLHFSPNGLYMYSVHQTSRAAGRWTLSSPWDISTASNPPGNLNAAMDLGGGTNPKSICLSYYGDKAYTATYGGVIRMLDLSTPWDISSSSLSHSGNYSDTGNTGTNVWGCEVSEDGTKMILLSFSPNKVHEYTLTTPYDITTASRVGEYTISQEALLRGIAFSPTGETMVVCGQINDTVYQYSL